MQQSMPCETLHTLLANESLEQLPLQQAHVPPARHLQAATIQGCQAALTEVPQGQRVRTQGSHLRRDKNWRDPHSCRWVNRRLSLNLRCRSRNQNVTSGQSKFDKHGLLTNVSKPELDPPQRLPEVQAAHLQCHLHCI